MSQARKSDRNRPKPTTDLNLGFRLVKKGVIFRASIRAWTCSESLQRIAIFFENDVCKLYKFPSFEQTHHLECSLGSTSKQPIHLSLYQEFFFLNNDNGLLIVDIVSQTIIGSVVFGADLTQKFQRAEVGVIPLLLEEKSYILIMTSTGTVLIATLPLNKHLQGKKSFECTLKIHDCSALRLASSGSLAHFEPESKVAKTNRTVFRRELQAELVFDSRNVPVLLTLISGRFSVRHSN